MRLRALPLPSAPTSKPSPNGDTVWETPFVLVFDEVEPGDREVLDDLADNHLAHVKAATGARGVLVFRSRVDLPEVE